MICIEQFERFTAKSERLARSANPAAVMTDVEIIYDLYKYLPQMRVAVEN